MTDFPQNPENPNDHPDLAEFGKILAAYQRWGPAYMKSVPTSYQRRDLKYLLYNLDIQVKTLRMALEMQKDGDLDDIVEPQRTLFAIQGLSMNVANAALCLGNRALVMRGAVMKKGAAR